MQENILCREEVIKIPTIKKFIREEEALGRTVVIDPSLFKFVDFSCYPNFSSVNTKSMNKELFPDDLNYNVKDELIWNEAISGQCLYTYINGKIGKYYVLLDKPLFSIKCSDHIAYSLNRVLILKTRCKNPYIEYILVHTTREDKNKRLLTGYIRFNLIQI